MFGRSKIDLLKFEDRYSNVSACLKTQGNYSSIYGELLVYLKTTWLVANSVDTDQISLYENMPILIYWKLYH